MASASLAAGTLVAGRYRVVGEIGRGGMGAVYAVEHIATGALMALKVMLDAPEPSARFHREARAAACIASEHVVTVTDTDTAPELGGAPFLVMELLDGEDVERRLLRIGRLPARETLAILVQVARGVDDAHAAGVVHRDLKPENVFLHRRADGTPIVKVVDFGLAKEVRLEADGALPTLGTATNFIGTPLYMAPEQIHADDRVGPPTDVWAVGLMALRMLTGEVYWTGETVPEIFVQIVADHRTPPSERWSGLGEAFDRWFLKSVAPRASDRYASVGEQIAALSRALEFDAVVVPVPAPSPSPSRQAPPSTPPSARPRNSLSPMDVTVSAAVRVPLRAGRAVVLPLLLVALVGVGVTLFVLRQSPRAARAVAAPAAEVPFPSAPRRLVKNDAAAPLP